jgi:hypothetical protein
MNERPSSAGASIYPHLKSQERPAQQPSNKSIAGAMYPALVKPTPLPSDPYLRYMQAMGLIRTDARQGRGW